MSTPKSDNTPTFGKRLREVRKRVGLTQQELADKATMAKDTLSRYERGVLAPTIEAFSKLYYTLLEKDRSLTSDDLLFGNYEESHKRYRVKNLGQIKSLLFHGGGRAVVSYDQSDISSIFSVLIHHEKERTKPNQQVINSLEKLQNRYYNQEFIIESEAFIAAHEARLKSVMKSMEEIESEECEKPFRRIKTIKK